MQSTLSPAPTLLSVIDLARRYGVSQATIWRWRESGILPAPVKVGPKLVRWTGEAIDEWERERNMHGEAGTE